MEKITRVTEENWKEYKDFLESGMKKEFPKEEQLSLEQIFQRVSTQSEDEGKAQHFVGVIEGTQLEGVIDKRAFTIYHLFQTENGQPFALTEYIAAVGKTNKRNGYGTQLFEETNKELLTKGINEVVIETDPVPRIIKNPVHKDIKSFNQTYTQFGDSYSFIKGIKRWPGIDQRNMFWQRIGFNIIPELPYCQPDLIEKQTSKRVPLDLQILRLDNNNNTDISMERLKQILTSMARHNYHLGESSEQFVQLQTNMSYNGNDLKNPEHTLQTIPYTKLLETPQVQQIMLSTGIKSRY